MTPVTAEVSEPAFVTTEPLQFQRTVDRGMAHRAAVSEVFVTDVQPFTDRSCLVGVQLPLSHSYYSDHAQAIEIVDPLLVLEACRQAAICGAHAVVEIPTGESMLVGTYEIELTDPAALVVGARPHELVLETAYIPTDVRAGRTRKGRVEHTLRLGSADGPRVGFHAMDVVMLRGSQYDAMRRAQRGTVAPSTVDMVAPDSRSLVAAALVGRAHPRNVVLSAVQVGSHAVTAQVTPHPANRGLFEHSYDHLPAMVLTEAARQISFLASDGGTGSQASRSHVVGIKARFLAFAELDAPVEVSTPLTTPGALTGPTDVATAFTQNGATVAEIVVTLIPSDHVEKS